MKYAHIIAFILLVVGGLNWGLYAVSGWEIGQLFGGMEEMVSKAIYLLVGIAAVFEIATHGTRCRMCATPGVSA
jgi:uncharacterized protein